MNITQIAPVSWCKKINPKLFPFPLPLTQLPAVASVGTSDTVYTGRQVELQYFSNFISQGSSQRVSNKTNKTKVSTKLTKYLDILYTTFLLYQLSWTPSPR